jgi:hypothetical protein
MVDKFKLVFGQLGKPFLRFPADLETMPMSPESVS